MNATEQRDFVEAVDLAQSGKKDEAYEKLLALSKATGARDPQLLLWLAFTTHDLDEAETCISMAETKIPEDPSITAAYTWLRNERAKPKVSKIISPPFAQLLQTTPIEKPTFQVASQVQPAPPPPPPTQPVFIYAPPPS